MTDVATREPAAPLLGGVSRTDAAHRADGFASALQAARRAADASASDVARRAGLDESAVRRAESGDDVGPEATTSLCAALGIDPTPYAPGLPSGPVSPPVPVDRAHARALAAFGEAVAGRHGWLVCPDVRAWAAAEGWSHDAADGLRSGLDGTRAAHSTAYLGAAALGLAGIVASALAGSAVGLLVSVTAFAALPLGVAAAYVARTRRDQRELDRLDHLASEGAGMARRGYLVDAEGLTVLSVTEREPSGPVTAAEHPASGVYATEVRDVGEGHVTLVVEGTGGRVEVPWIRRTRAVTEAVASWTTRPGAPWKAVAR